MALIACPGCDTTISDQVPHCPHCGRPIASSSPTPHSPPTRPHPPAPTAHPHSHPAPPPRILAPPPRPVPSARPPKGSRKTGCFLIGCLGFIIVLTFLYVLGTLTKRPVAQEPPPAATTSIDAEQARQNAVKSLEEGRKSMDVAVRKTVSGKTDTADETPMQRAAAEKAREMLAQTIAAELGVMATVRGARSDRLTLEASYIDAKWTTDFRNSDAVRALQNAGFRRVEVKDGKRYRERFELEGMPQH